MYHVEYLFTFLQSPLHLLEGLPLLLLQVGERGEVEELDGVQVEAGLNPPAGLVQGMQTGQIHVAASQRHEYMWL
jgi:hypothetical protein